MYLVHGQLTCRLARVLIRQPGGPDQIALPQETQTANERRRLRLWGYTDTRDWNGPLTHGIVSNGLKGPLTILCCKKANTPLYRLINSEGNTRRAIHVLCQMLERSLLCHGLLSIQAHPQVGRPPRIVSDNKDKKGKAHLGT